MWSFKSGPHRGMAGVNITDRTVSQSALWAQSAVTALVLVGQKVVLASCKWVLLHNVSAALQLSPRGLCFLPSPHGLHPAFRNAGRRKEILNIENLCGKALDRFWTCLDKQGLETTFDFGWVWLLSKNKAREGQPGKIGLRSHQLMRLRQEDFKFKPCLCQFGQLSEPPSQNKERRVRGWTQW